MKLFGQYKSSFLLTAILLSVLTSPLDGKMDFAWIAVTLGSLWAVLIGIGGYLILHSKRWLTLYTTAIAFVAVVTTIEIVASASNTLIFAKNIGFIFIQGCALYVALRYAISHSGNALDRTIAGVCGYFLLGRVWSHFFIMIQCVDPAAFQAGNTGEIVFETDLLYFSLVNLTTLGYGDIIPVNSFARIVATLESAFGTLYLAVMVATLVSELRTGKIEN